MKKHLGMLVTGMSALILTAGLVAYAQDGPPPGPPRGEGIMGFEPGFGGHGPVVKGVPFSAQTTAETVAVLQDGTHIDRKTSGTFARDSQGRTRREETLPPIAQAGESGTAPHVVFIQDPVAGTHTMLEPDKKIARTETAHGRGHEGGPNAMAQKRGPRADAANVTTESLGTQTINGVAATGTRTTRTIPVGAIGNDKPIQMVTEKWYSADLQADVMTKYTNPLMGTTTIQLTNISREEPAATLFQVPSDYTVKAGHGRGGFGQPAAPPPPPSEQQ
jgi:hypothetical protein